MLLSPWLCLAWALAAAVVALMVASVRLFFPSPRRPPPLVTLVVLGSGGHTTEMQRLVSSLDKRYSLVMVAATDDGLSVRRASRWFPPNEQPVFARITRSRTVGQSYVSSVWTTMQALVAAFLLVVRAKPHLVICNGPGTCVPVCVAAKLINRATLVYVESFCRVHSLSLSGLLLYYVADHFLVQWRSLALKYRRTRYCGLLV